MIVEKIKKTSKGVQIYGWEWDGNNQKTVKKWIPKEIWEYWGLEWRDYPNPAKEDYNGKVSVALYVAHCLEI